MELMEAVVSDSMQPGFRLTEAGLLPTDWVVRPFLSTVQIANGQVDPRVEPFRSMILVAPDHIESGTGRLLRQRTAAEQGAISGKYFFSAGDIVYSKIRPYLRKATLADFNGLCSADMYPLRPAKDVAGGYMLAILLSHHFTRYAESVSVRSGMPKINREELAEYNVGLPPTKTEQEAIATALSDADALLNSLEQLIAKKKALKQGAMQALLTPPGQPGHKRLPGFKGEWEEKSLGEIGFISGGGVDKTTLPGEQPVRLLNYMDVYRKPFTFSYAIKQWVSAPAAKAKACAILKGDVFFTPSSELRSDIAISSVAMEDIADAVYSYHLVRLRLHQQWDLAFRTYIFKTRRFLDQAETICEGSGTRYVVTLPKFRALRVCYPDDPLEQTAIATVLANMDNELDALELKLEKLRKVKQGMMQELLTGKKRLVK